MADQKEFVLSTIIQVLDKATAPLAKVGTAFGTLGKRLDVAGKKMGDVGNKLQMRLTLPLLGAGLASLKTSFDFNKGMANIATLIPGNIERIKELKTGIQDMAMDVGKRTGDLATGMYQVISAFGDSGESMKRLEVNAKAATAGLSTTIDAINLTSAVTKAYGDTTGAAVEKAADLGLLTVRLGQTTFPELASSLGRVTPLAAQLNVTQEELFTGFATLTGVTGSAAEVSTQLAAVMRAALKPTEGMKKAVKALGYESAAQMVKQKGLVGTIQALMEVTQGDEEATAALFGRVEGLTAVFSLSDKLAGDFNRKLKAMQNSAGTLDEAFKEVDEGIAKDAMTWEKFKSTLQVTGQEIGDTLAPTLADLLKTLQEYLVMFRKLDPQTKKMVLKFAGLALAAGPLLRIFGGLTRGAGLLFRGFGALLKMPAVFAKTATSAASISASLGTMGTAMLGVAAAVGAFKGLDLALDKIQKAMDPKWFKTIGQFLGSSLAGLPVLSAFGLGWQTRAGKMMQQEKTKSESEITVKVEAEPGTSATIDKIKSTGNTKPTISNHGWLGNLLQFAQ